MNCSRSKLVPGLQSRARTAPVTAGPQPFDIQAPAAEPPQSIEAPGTTPRPLYSAAPAHTWRPLFASPSEPLKLLEPTSGVLPDRDTLDLAHVFRRTPRVPLATLEPDATDVPGRRVRPAGSDALPLP